MEELPKNIRIDAVFVKFAVSGAEETLREDCHVFAVEVQNGLNASR